MLTSQDPRVQQAPRGEAGPKGPAALNLGEDCDFYSQGNQHAVTAFMNGSDITISMFLKEHSGLREKKPEKGNRVWLVGCAPQASERREVKLWFKAEVTGPGPE